MTARSNARDGRTAGDQFDTLRACSDPDLFAKWFRDKATWEAWFAFLAAPFALPMDEQQCAPYRKHTGRQEPPVGRSINEAGWWWGVEAGRA